MSEYKATSHPLGKGERLKSPGIGIFRFRHNNNLDVSGGKAVLQKGSTAAEQQDAIKICMHADMGLQLALDIANDVLNIRNAGFLNFPGNIVAFKAVLQISLFNQESYFYRREGT